MTSASLSTDAHRLSDRLAADLALTRQNVAALGSAIHAAKLVASPSLARAVQAQQNLYDRVRDEFGLLTSGQVADRIGSRASARRNAAAAARRGGRLMALRRGRYLLYPGFQFDASGIRPVITELLTVADQHDWEESDLVEWLVSPTTYLGGRRPVDVLDETAEVLGVARASLGVSW